MNPVGTLALVALGLHEVHRGSQRAAQGSAALSSAKARAKALGRPLLVVDGQQAKHYGCSDACIDQGGCGACGGTIDLPSALVLPEASHVVVETFALELLEEPWGALASLLSVAGDAANYFAVRMQPSTLASLHPSARWVYDPALQQFRPVDGDRIVRGTFLGISILTMLRG